MKHSNTLVTLLFSFLWSGTALAQDPPALHVDVLYGVVERNVMFVIRQEGVVGAPVSRRVVRAPRQSNGCCSGARRPGLSVGPARAIAPRTFTVLNQDGSAQVLTARASLAYSTGRDWRLGGEEQRWRLGLVVEAKIGAFVALEGEVEEASFEPLVQRARPELLARRNELIPNGSIRTLVSHGTPALWILGRSNERQVVLRGSQILFWMEGPPQYQPPSPSPVLPRSLRRAAGTIAGAVHANGSLFLLMTPRARSEGARGGFVLVSAGQQDVASQSFATELASQH